ncbi:MAG: hypothetical protein WBF73_09260 [Bradyrhizobium sp.]
MISFGASRLFRKRLRAQFAVDQQQGCENEEAQDQGEAGAPVPDKLDNARLQPQPPLADMPS